MWFYNNEKIDNLEVIPQDAIGFIYKITNKLNGKFYIGRKVLFNKKRSTIGKREKVATKTRKKFKTTVKESDWLTYYGSSKELSQDILTIGVENFKREILEYCCTKKYLSFCEISYQIKYNVLVWDSYNGNILGRYYRKDMENCKD